MREASIIDLSISDLSMFFFFLFFCSFPNVKHQRDERDKNHAQMRIVKAILIMPRSLERTFIDLAVSIFYEAPDEERGGGREEKEGTLEHICSDSNI